MQVIITYDVSQRHPEVKREMKRKGFNDRWVTKNVTYYLPNTTLWHADLPTCHDAINIFHEVIAVLNANQPLKDIIAIKHEMAFPLIAGWSGNPGEAHT